MPTPLQLWLDCYRFMLLTFCSISALAAASSSCSPIRRAEVFKPCIRTTSGLPILQSSSSCFCDLMASGLDVPFLLSSPSFETKIFSTMVPISGFNYLFARELRIAMRKALEKAGVEFTNGKRPGVRLKG